MEQQFKYQELLERDGLAEICPPLNIQQNEILSYHFVKSPIKCEFNFKPKVLKRPIRVNSLDDLRLCSNYALSFFTSEDSARQVFKGFPNRIKQLLGYTNIAQGTIKPFMGACTQVDHSGHFDLYENENIEMCDHFHIIGDLT